jgi:hypothetical protein
MDKESNMSQVVVRLDESQQGSRTKQIDLLTAYKTLLTAHLRTSDRSKEQILNLINTEKPSNDSKQQRSDSA